MKKTNLLLNNTVIIALCFIVLSCGTSDNNRVKRNAKNSDDSDRVIHYPNSEVTVKQNVKELRDIVIEVNEIPPDYRAQRYADQSQTQEYEEELRNQEAISVYKIRIKTRDGSDIWQHPSLGGLNNAQKQQYFAIRFQENIDIQFNDSIYPCVLYSLDQVQHIKPFIDIVAGFEISATEQGKRIVIVDDQYFGIGKIKLNVSS